MENLLGCGSDRTGLATPAVWTRVTWGSLLTMDSWVTGWGTGSDRLRDVHRNSNFTFNILKRSIKKKNVQCCFLSRATLMSSSTFTAAVMVLGFFFSFSWKFHILKALEYKNFFSLSLSQEHQSRYWKFAIISFKKRVEPVILTKADFHIEGISFVFNFCRNCESHWSWQTNVVNVSTLSPGNPLGPLPTGLVSPFKPLSPSIPGFPSKPFFPHGPINPFSPLKPKRQIQIWYLIEN